MKSGFGVLIGDILRSKSGEDAALSVPEADDTASVYLQELCLTIKGLSIHDDLRRDMSSAYDNGKFFLACDGVVQNLLWMSKGFLIRPRVAAAALSALKQLVLSEEAVQVVAMHGAMELPAAVLGWTDAPVVLVRSVAGMMRNLCADDKRKNKLVSDGTLLKLVRAMHDERYTGDFQFMENAAACLAAMSLRSQGNSTVIVESGAITALVSGMRKHRDKEAFQRQACLAVRNIAARGGESVKAALLDLGIEGVLRAAGALQGAVDEAYAALRDLGCEVQFVKISADGHALPVYEQFGTGRKLQFNPVYDEANDIGRRVENEAVAPFAKPPSPPHDHDHDHDHTHNNCC
jgi:hypothetical protein